MRSALWPALVLAAAAAAATTPGEPALLPVPHPDLQRLGEVGAHLAEEIARLEAVRAQPGAGGGRLAEAHGELGRLYLAYELWQPAEACLVNAAALAPADPRWSYYLGYLHRRAGRLEPAAEWLERTLELRPGYLPAVLRLGRVYLELGRAERIAPLLAAAGAAAAEESAVRVLRGRAALALRDWQAAREEFSAVLAAEPGAGWVHYQLALAYRGLGRLEEARRHLELQTPGGFPIADPLVNELPALTTGAGRYRRRAMAAYEAGRVEQAVAEFRRALESDPARTDVRIGLALVLAESGELEGAREEYRRVLEQEPEALLARLGLGRALAGLGRPAEAVAEFDAVLARQPDATDALAARARALAALGRHEAALADHARLLELEPWNPELRLARARGLLRAGRPEEALVELEAVVAADPANAAAALDLGALCARLGRPEAAARLGAVLELEAPAALHAAAHFNLAQLAAAGGAAGRAGDHYRAAAELRPDWDEAHRRLGETLERAGRLAAAAAAFGRVVALRPDDAGARLAEGRCLTGAGRFAEAAARLEEGVARLPGSAGLAGALARLLAASPQAELRDGARALELASAALDAEPAPEHAEAMAMALAELGRFAEAGGLMAELLGRAESSGAPEATLRRLRAGLAAYRAGRPARLGSAAAPDP